MYRYIDDKDFLKRMKSTCADIVNQLVQEINRDGALKVSAHLVGSGSRNLITQNEEKPIDLDYNLCIEEFTEIYQNDGRQIKEYVQKKFNEILNRNDLNDCSDSTSVLTTDGIYFTKGNKTEFSIDLAIVKEDCFGWHRLIHEKTGYVSFDRYYWNQVPNSTEVYKRVDRIKEDYRWPEVIDTYLKKKNMYFFRQEKRSSFEIYIEAVNEVYFQQYRY